MTLNEMIGRMETLETTNLLVDWWGVLLGWLAEQLKNSIIRMYMPQVLETARVEVNDLCGLQAPGELNTHTLRYSKNGGNPQSM